MDNNTEGILRTVRNTELMCDTFLSGTTVKAETASYSLERKRDWFAEGHPRITALIQGSNNGTALPSTLHYHYVHQNIQMF